MMEKRWAWALSGSGHFFTESFDLINTLGAVDLFVSRAAEELLSMYQQKKRLSKMRIFRDTTASSVPVGQFYRGIYHSLVMAPMSSNTVAKCVYGLSDNLVTNVFAQAGKCRVPCIYFPCDTAPELLSMAPKGMVQVFPRAVDLENVQKLQKFEGTKVVVSLAELSKALRQRQDEL